MASSLGVGQNGSIIIQPERFEGQQRLPGVVDEMGVTM
jgi:hypothetical protein